MAVLSGMTGRKAKNNMNINLSDETIKTIEKALLTKQFFFKEKIELAAYTEKVSADRVSEFKSELARVEIAISEFNASINLNK